MSSLYYLSLIVIEYILYETCMYCKNEHSFSYKSGVTYYMYFYLFEIGLICVNHN